MSEGEPRKKDREAAVKLIDRAYAEGRIVSADRSKRIEDVGRAQSTMELQLLVHDLELRDAASPAVPAPAVALQQSVEPVSPGAAPIETAPVEGDRSGADLAAAARQALDHGGVQVNSRRVIGVAVIVVAAVAVSGIGGLVAIVSSGGSNVPKVSELVQGPEVPGSQPEQHKPEVLSSAGMRQLVKAVVAKTGTSAVFDATLYPSYAVLNVPVDPTSQRSAGLYWDGGLRDWGPKSTSRGARLNLARLDPTVLVRLSKRARTNLVEDATSWYVIVHARDEQGASIYAYASNEFNEGGYLAATPSGKIVRRVTWP